MQFQVKMVGEWGLEDLESNGLDSIGSLEKRAMATLSGMVSKRIPGEPVFAKLVIQIPIVLGVFKTQISSRQNLGRRAIGLQLAIRLFQRIRTNLEAQQW